ncbi:hypothetical protein CVS40_2926 [Lucilia cuprina]|nr:hypothetical protein CVS40_2926 [Lucilia cuprina]
MPQMCLEEEVTQEHELQRIPEKIILRQKLKKWIIKTKPTRSCAEELLAILSEEGMDVPLSVEGLLRAKTKIVVRSVPPGSFHYLGIENELKKVEDILQNYATVELDVNVDGIPLFKSSRTQLWPILIKVVNVKEKIMPMPVGIFVGPGKPHCSQTFLKTLLRKLMFLNGSLKYSGKTIALQFRNLCCDTPAKSFCFAVFRDIPLHMGAQNAHRWPKNQ